MTIQELMLMRIAAACWVSAHSHAEWLIRVASGRRRSALYWRARSVVMLDRSLRKMDGQPVRGDA